MWFQFIDFVPFPCTQYPEVAQVAADAMNGYFMFSQKLDVKVWRGRGRVLLSRCALWPDSDQFA